MYFEVYDPALLTETKPTVGANIRIGRQDAGSETGSGNVSVNKFAKDGSPLVAAGLRLPTKVWPRATTASTEAPGFHRRLRVRTPSSRF